VFGSIDSTMITALLPEILLLVLAGLVLLFDILWKEEKNRNLGWLTAGGMLIVLIVAWTVARPGDEVVQVWGGMLRHDWLAFVFKSIAIFGAGITALLSMDLPNLGKKGEFYILLITATIGMTLMSAASDLIMLFLAIETTSIPLYVLAGFMKDDNKSTEAGFKYLLFGALTSSVMLYGFSLLYGFSNTTDLYALAQGLVTGEIGGTGIIVSALLVLVGFGFKISAVPFHFWAPDVYEGAPTPVTGFLSTASKAAGFAVVLRFLLAAYPGQFGLGLESSLAAVLAALTAVTMTLGNTIAIVQSNIKRLLAYSSIAHAGYVLLGVVAATELGVTSAVFYLIAYTMTNLAAFGVVAIVSRAVGSDEIAAYAGMSRRSSGLSLVLLVALLSLAGVPPLAGFIAKIWVFAAAVQSNLIWLAVVGVLNAIIGVYYYMISLKVV